MMDVICLKTLQGCRDRGEYIDQFDADRMRSIGEGFLKGAAASHRSYGVGAMFLDLIDEVERLRFFNEGIGKELDELRNEVERLRKIEDAARAWSFSSDPGAGNEFIEIMQANPRPEGS